MIDGLYMTGWQIRRGRSYFTDRTQTGTAQADYVDTVGALDPTNSTGPFYPMNPGAPFALSLWHPTRHVWHQLFRGSLEQMPQTVDLSEKFISGSLMAADLMSLLAIGEIPPGVDFDASASGSSAANTIGDTTYAAQGVQDRIKAILADGGIPTALTNIFTGNVNVQFSVYPPGTNILEALWDAADAEFPGLANFYVDKSGRLTFHGRLARFNPSDAQYRISTWNVGDHAAVDADPTMAIVSGLTFDRDVNKVINASLFSPDNILDTQIAGQLASDAASIAAYGNRTYSAGNLLTLSGENDGLNANEETKLFSNYFPDNFHDAQNRITQLVFKIVPAGAPNEQAQWDLLCGVEISDLVNITTTHPGGGGFTAEPYFVEGISYDAAPSGDPDRPLITLTLDLSPQAYFASGWPPEGPT